MAIVGDRRRRTTKTAVPLFALVIVAVGGPCAKVGKGKSDPASSSSSAMIMSASAAAASASASAAAAAAASASAAAVAAANAAALDKAKQNLADIKWMVAHNVSANPSKSGEGDVTSKCDAVESSRANKELDSDPEYKKTIDESVALCAFDVPLITASEALDHLRTSSSQASKLLMCTVASKECDRARTVKPTDKKLRQLDARRITACGH